jgi:hypothetical protein
MPVALSFFASVFVVMRMTSHRIECLISSTYYYHTTGVPVPYNKSANGAAALVNDSVQHHEDIIAS